MDREKLAAAAARLGLSTGRLARLCRDRRVAGAVRVKGGNRAPAWAWEIPPGFSRAQIGKPARRPRRY